MTDETNISEDEKIKIAANFLFHSPPGEFREVFLDLRGLLNDDRILKKSLNSTNARYNQDQFVQCELDSKENCLITEYNELPNGRYFDPKSKQSFKFDHLHLKASEIEPHNDVDSHSEPWRSALERELSQYVRVHYKDGASSVFASTGDDGSSVNLVACIEAHKFQPSNFWNARWRARWSLSFQPGSSNEVELVGIIKVQVHYYEDGNVQLVSHKEVKEYVTLSSDHERTAKQLIQAIEKCENEYQSAISENYQTMSETTFKALRRALPVTKSKIDWNKISSYKIANELKSSTPS